MINTITFSYNHITVNVLIFLRIKYCNLNNNMFDIFTTCTRSDNSAFAICIEKATSNY